MLAATLLGMLSLAASALAAPADQITPKTFPVPGPTAWRPLDCRSVPFSHPVLLPRTAYRRAHGDLESTNEVDLAYAPVFAREWVAEQSLYQVTTPAFDGAGNLYMTPLLPHEPILLISLDPATGARRFVVPLAAGDRGGGAVPLVLRDPEAGGEVVYINAYQRMLAVRTDGTTVWDVPTGLGPASAAHQSPIGLAWVPTAEAIVGLLRDGFIFLLDRRTGAPLLPPMQLPGERTPPIPSTISPSLAATVDVLLQPLVAFPTGSGVVPLINVLLGGDSEVANNLSVDPRTNRLWIAATARDGEDGAVDSVSQLGALYRFDVVRAGVHGRWWRGAIASPHRRGALVRRRPRGVARRDEHGAGRRPLPAARAATPRVLARPRPDDRAPPGRRDQVVRDATRSARPRCGVRRRRPRRERCRARRGLPRIRDRRPDAGRRAALPDARCGRARRGRRRAPGW